MVRRLISVGLILVWVLACRSGDISVNVIYDNVAGVTVEDVVIFEQNVVGGVEFIQYNTDGTYTVKLTINKGFSNAVTEFSEFQVVDNPKQKGRKAIEIRITRQGGRLLTDGDTVRGKASSDTMMNSLQKELEAGLGFIIEQIERFRQDARKIPQSDAYKELKRSMEALAGEIRRSEEEARERIKREWMPKLERQLEALRKHLRQLGREKELAPIEERIERIRRI